MTRLVFVLALSTAATGCNKQHQLTNKQVAMGVVGAAAIVGLILVLSLQCNELTQECN